MGNVLYYTLCNQGIIFIFTLIISQSIFHSILLISCKIFTQIQNIASIIIPTSFDKLITLDLLLL